MSTDLVSLGIATWQTLYMVFIASFVSLLVGLGLGTILFLTQKQQLLANKILNLSLGAVVNIGRSIPFIIFMIAIIPFTKLLVGTSIGINAAVVPLTLAAIPFYARIAETALQQVPAGLTAAALAMGANTWQIVYKVLLPESLPALIQGATLTVISLVAYSAMAGTVGGGGLGELAIEYGYQRFDVIVMLETVIVLVIMVQAMQWYGDHLAKRRSYSASGCLVCSCGALVSPACLCQPRKNKNRHPHWYCRTRHGQDHGGG